MKKKLLLTAVFGPYGIKNDYAEGIGMQMELLNNQITREQGIHSPRQTYWTFPLYMLAENLTIPTVVLDFPKWNDFKKELKIGNYSHVGINFIVPNVLKAKRMTEYIRKFYPKIKILLGGYGTLIPNLKKIVPHDDKCIGEGVRWIQRYFNEKKLLKKPIVHPVIQNPVYQKIYGVKQIPNAAVLLPGLGCENGCEFCVTSHMFHKKHIPLLPTGLDCYNACLKAENQINASGFSIMDENFLKNPERTRNLLKLMEKNMKNYAFEIFSSAEVVVNLGIDFLVRLGVKMVWIGVESKKWAHAKVKNIDLKKLISELQKKGIVVNSSAILFLDHHDEKGLQEDIDWVIDLGADLTQFMNYTPLPETDLYCRLKNSNKMKSLDKVPYSKYTGAEELSWIHPYINDPKKHFAYLKNAFRKKYLKSGSGLLNMTKTAIKGLKTAREDYSYRIKNKLVWNPKSLKYEKMDNEADYKPDDYFKYRIRKIERVAMISRYSLFTLKWLSPNKLLRKKAKNTIKLANDVLGKPKFVDRIKSGLLFISALIEGVKFYINKLSGHETIIYQPPSRKMGYNLETLTMIDIIRNQLKIWAKSKKSFQWVKDEFTKIPSKEKLLEKSKQSTLKSPSKLSILKMQNIWEQMFHEPDVLKKYWTSVGGKI